MKHHQLASLIFISAWLCAPCATAFTVSSPFSLHSRCPSSASASSTTALGITSEEILANARRAAGLPPEEKQPMLYDDDLLDDMQQALLTLEKRVKEGPGSLSILEVEEFSGRVHRILQEARENPDKRLPRPAKKDDSATVGATAAPPPPPRPQMAAPVAASAAAAAAAAQRPPSPPPQQQQRQQPAPAAVVANGSSTNKMDKSLDEGPSYDGRGGMGQPRGTVNTYVIDGMDEMSPAEYQKALQESVLERQRQRKSSGMTTGNRATWDYLNQLTAKGDDGVLSKGGKKNSGNYGPSGGGGSN